MAQSPAKIIPCDIAGCTQPAAEIIDDTITIISRHHGKRHPKTLTKAELLRLLTEQPETKSLTSGHKTAILPR